uniref:Transcriptional regulator NRG1 n=1 Tax=Anthurium amnicola TaxID=1678845 RepID=A0A1D1XY36_9ARAE
MTYFEYQCQQSSFSKPFPYSYYTPPSSSYSDPYDCGYSQYVKQYPAPQLPPSPPNNTPPLTPTTIDSLHASNTRIKPEMDNSVASSRVGTHSRIDGGLLEETNGNQYKTTSGQGIQGEALDADACKFNGRLIGKTSSGDTVNLLNDVDESNGYLIHSCNTSRRSSTISLSTTLALREGSTRIRSEYIDDTASPSWASTKSHQSLSLASLSHISPSTITAEEYMHKINMNMNINRNDDERQFDIRNKKKRVPNIEDGIERMNKHNRADNGVILTDTQANITTNAGSNENTPAVAAGQNGSNQSNASSISNGKQGTAQKNRKFFCTWEPCGKSFTTSGHLARHFRIHTGEKNFKCFWPGCESRFSRQDNMMQHYRTHTSSRSRHRRESRSLPVIGRDGRDTSRDMYFANVNGNSANIRNYQQPFVNGYGQYCGQHNEQYETNSVNCVQGYANQQIQRMQPHVQQQLQSNQSISSHRPQDTLPPLSLVVGNAFFGSDTSSMNGRIGNLGYEAQRETYRERV